MNNDPLINYKDVFYVDGSYLDMYILETNEQDWQKLLDFLRSSPYAIEFLVDGQSTPLPERIETIFALQEDHGILLHIDKEHLALNSFFFTREEIDFDLDPSDFQGDTADQQISRLFEFLRTVGRLLNKVVVLTPEGGGHTPDGGGPTAILFRFDPKTDEEIWL